MGERKNGRGRETTYNFDCLNCTCERSAKHYNQRKFEIPLFDDEKDKIIYCAFAEKDVPLKKAGTKLFTSVHKFHSMTSAQKTKMFKKRSRKHYRDTGGIDDFHQKNRKNFMP